MRKSIESGGFTSKILGFPVGVHLPKVGVFLTESGSARTDYLHNALALTKCRFVEDYGKEAFGLNDHHPMTDRED